MNFKVISFLSLLSCTSLITSPALCMGDPKEDEDIANVKASPVVKLRSVKIVVSESDHPAMSKFSTFKPIDLMLPPNKALKEGLAQALEYNKENLLKNVMTSDEIKEYKLTVSNFRCFTFNMTDDPPPSVDIDTYYERDILVKTPMALGLTTSEWDKINVKHKGLSVKVKKLDP